jgi:Na+/proline symporter
MTVAEWIPIFVITVMMFRMAIGPLGRRLRPDDYFTGGQLTSLRRLVFFTFGAGTCTDSTSSVVAGSWRSGLSGLWWQFIWLPVIPAFWLVAPLLRRLRSVTTADFFRLRFGGAAGMLYALYGMGISVVVIAAVLFTSARLLNILMDPVFGDLSELLQLRFPALNVRAVLTGPEFGAMPLVSMRPLQGEALAGICLAVLVIVCGLPCGLYAQIRIDTLQGILRIILTLILLPLVFSKIGGLGSLHLQQDSKLGMLDFVASSEARLDEFHEPFTPFYLVMLCLAALAGVIVQPHVTVLCGTGRRELDARAGLTGGHLLKRFMAIVWVVFGLACLAWYLGPQSPLSAEGAPAEDFQLWQDLRVAAAAQPAELTAEQLMRVNKVNQRFADRLFGLAVRDLCHDLLPGLTGLFAAMVIASTVSHAATHMIVGSGLFAAHVYRLAISPEQTPEHYRLVGRLCGPLLVLAALVLQMSFNSIGDALRLFIKTPAIIGVSMWMGLVWTRWNYSSVWAATCAGAFVGLVCGYFPEEVQRTFPDLADRMFVTTSAGTVMLDAWKIALILLASLGAGVFATLLTEPQPPGQLEFFYRLIRTPVGATELDSDVRSFVAAEDDRDLLPCLSIAGFQFPGATRGGVIGLVLSTLLIVAMVFGTKWLSQLI